MDLKEARGLGARHPWELARLDALRRILSGTLRDGLKVLDLGCGDGFVSRELFNERAVKVTAVDSNFTAADMAALSGQSRNIAYSRTLEGDGRFDLVLLLDVVEHVEDDLGLLMGIAQKRLASGGRILITAPAFNALFSGHDRFLGHRRRYNPGELDSLARRAGLKTISSGYLFSALLLLRALSAVSEKAFGRVNTGTEGAGGWKGGAAATFMVKTALDIDNSLLFALNRAAGIRLPGLTGWVLCEKQL
ncbi:MAG: class I SAM-dependent methyltransferase [Deltaproteobacteria bacterium]|nr:class I SAM-dependent methyltransferase [Deltaproteobacteria bacterium]